MPDLNFKVESAEPEAYAASPHLSFALRVSNDEPLDAAAELTVIHAVALRCQIRIEPAQRNYEPAEKDRLRDLFGEPARWGQTLRPMLWAHTSTVVPSFTGSTTINLPVPCTYDFNLAAAKYFYALADGQVPLCLLFSGTVFYAAPQGFQVEQIPWDKETNFRLPVATWKRMMQMYYPNTAWLCLAQDAFDDLAQFKSRSGLPTFEAAIEKLLSESQAQVNP